MAWLSFHTLNPGIHYVFLCWLHLPSVERAAGDRRRLGPWACLGFPLGEVAPESKGQGNPLHHRELKGKSRGVKRGRGKATIFFY